MTLYALAVAIIVLYVVMVVAHSIESGHTTTEIEWDDFEPKAPGVTSQTKSELQGTWKKLEELRRSKDPNDRRSNEIWERLTSGDPWVLAEFCDLCGTLSVERPAGNRPVISFLKAKVGVEFDDQLSGAAYLETSLMKAAQRLMDAAHRLSDDGRSAEWETHLRAESYHLHLQLTESYLECAVLPSSIQTRVDGPADFLVLRGAYDRLAADEWEELEMAHIAWVRVRAEQRLTCFLSENGERRLRGLALKRSQLTYVDDYGDPQDGDFVKEVGRFIDQKLPNLFGPTKFDPRIDNRGWAIDLVLALVDEFALEADGDSTSGAAPAPGSDAIEFEHAIAAAFCRRNFDGRVTAASGDQGADVLAHRNGRCVFVVQAKCWSSPVGNKAVQEIHAAQTFYDAERAMVVGVSGFTKAAKQLSESTGVSLVDFSDLDHFLAEFNGQDPTFDEPSAADEEGR